MKYFDTHCDTLYALTRKERGFDNDVNHVTLRGIKDYEVYEQMFAVWSHPSRTDDENWAFFLRAVETYKKELVPLRSKSFIPHLSVEGGALIRDDISRLDVLSKLGVRMFALVWENECLIGGAHNTNIGLTPFGKEVVKRLCELDIVPDVSHASDKMTYETCEIAAGLGCPVSASHSNSRTVRPHQRNLTDEMFRMIRDSGGTVGVNLCCAFLGDRINNVIKVSDVLTHIEHFLSLGGEDTVCLGCDLDGIHTLPAPMKGVRDVYMIAEEMKKIGYSDELINKITYSNASAFFAKHGKDRL